MEAGAKLRLWDPVAAEKFAQIHPQEQYCRDPLECATGADLLLVLTDWPDIRKIDLQLDPQWQMVGYLPGAPHAQAEPAEQHGVEQR